MPKLDKLTLYNSNDQVVDTLESTDEIMDDNSSSYTDDKGVHWIGIVTQAGGFYWTKAAELMAFLGKEYKPKTSTTAKTDEFEEISL